MGTLYIVCFEKWYIVYLFSGNFQDFGGSVSKLVFTRLLSLVVTIFFNKHWLIRYLVYNITLNQYSLILPMYDKLVLYVVEFSDDL